MKVVIVSMEKKIDAEFEIKMNDYQIFESVFE